MPNKLINDLVDLRIYPEHITVPEPNERPVFGDMHGNALKLLYLLIKFNLVTLSKEAYEAFRNIYLKSTPVKTAYEGIEDQTQLDPLSADDLVKCKEIIDSIVVSKSRALCLVGDLLADRGKSDLLTLWLIKKLSIAGLDLEIILSNHDQIFIAGIENALLKDNHTLFQYVRHSQRHSFNSLIKLIISGDVSQEEVKALYDVYKRHLCLFSIHEGTGQLLTTITHAPISLRVLLGLIDWFGIETKPFNPKLLTKLAQTTNAKFQEYVQKDCASALVPPMEQVAHYNAHPFVQLTWNRTAPLDVDRPSRLDSSTFEYVHGHTHVIDEDLHPHVHSLDNSNLGKREEFDFLLKRLGILKQRADKSFEYDPLALNPETNPLLAEFTATGLYPHGQVMVGPCLVLLQERVVPEAHLSSSATPASSATEVRPEPSKDASAGAGSGCSSNVGFFSASETGTGSGVRAEEERDRSKKPRLAYSTEEQEEISARKRCE